MNLIELITARDAIQKLNIGDKSVKKLDKLINKLVTKLYKDFSISNKDITDEAEDEVEKEKVQNS